MPFKDPAAKRAYDHAYQQAHKPQHNAANARYYGKNKPKINKRRRERYAENPEPELLKAADYRRNNPQKRLELVLAYAKRNPEKVNARNRRRQLRLRGAPVSDLTHAQWVMIQEAQDHRCAYCGKRCKGRLTQDHITPIIEGGSHTLHNVIGACRSCNSKKYVGPVLKPVQPLLL